MDGTDIGSSDHSLVWVELGWMSRLLTETILSMGESSPASCIACVEECISERESRKFEEGLNTKAKLDIYKWFGKSVEFKKKILKSLCRVHMV